MEMLLPLLVGRQQVTADRRGSAGKRRQRQQVDTPRRGKSPRGEAVLFPVTPAGTGLGRQRAVTVCDAHDFSPSFIESSLHTPPLSAPSRNQLPSRLLREAIAAPPKTLMPAGL